MRGLPTAGTASKGSGRDTAPADRVRRELLLPVQPVLPDLLPVRDRVPEMVLPSLRREVLPRAVTRGRGPLTALQQRTHRKNHPDRTRRGHYGMNILVPVP